MSFNGYLAWLICREQNKDRLREVERHRLVRQAWAARQRQAWAARQRQAWAARRPQGWTARRGRERVLIRALTWFGRCLVVWGQRLQERYDVVVESPALQAVNHASN